MIGFTDTLHTYLGTRDNYIVITDLHTLQFTVTHALGFSVFTSRILATDSKQSYCNFKSHIIWSRDSSVGTATGYGLDDWGSIPGRGKIVLFSTEYRPALGPTQPPIHWIPGVLSLRVSGKGVRLTIHLYLVTRSRMVELYLQSVISVF
jgi:hypothetical protein